MRNIQQLRQIRVLYDRLCSSLDQARLFEVPPGFSNNVAWNVGHVVVTQQLLHYRLSGLEPRVEAELIERYKKGTDTSAVDPDSHRKVLGFLHEAPARLAEDYEKGLFTSYQPYQTSAGVPLENIEDALAFNNVHEGIHLGVVMAMRKFLN